MLPAPKRDRLTLADVLPSCLAALAAKDNRMRLPRVTRAVVILVDGLGAASLRSRAGHARTLSAVLGASTTIDSGFPTTTASALATLATGTAPGQHGLVGYTVLDAANDRVVNQLSGWDERIDPATWQSQPTVFEIAVREGIRAVAVGPERYRDSGFSQAILRGAEYRAAASISARFEAARDWLREPGKAGLLYLYVPELDVAAHAVAIDHLAEKQCAAVTELGREGAKLVACVCLRQRLGAVGQRVAGERRGQGGGVEGCDVEAEFGRERMIEVQQPWRGRGGRTERCVEPLELASERVVETEGGG